MQQKTKSGTFFPRSAKGAVSQDWSPSGAAQPLRRKEGHLDNQAKLLLLVNILFIAASTLSGAFVTVYLWKVKSQFAPIAWFTFATHFAGALTFWLAGAWIKRANKMNALRAGMAVSAFFYLLVLLLGQHTVQYAALLGIVQGLASGFFWLAFNVVYFEITERDNRDRFNGWSGLLASGAGMLAPWISGLLIARMPDKTGYTLIFSLSLCLFIVGIIVSFFLQKRQTDGDYSWQFAFRTLHNNPNWRLAAGALAGQGLREGVFGFMISLLVYISTKSELSLGNYSLVTSAVGLASYFFIGKLFKPAYRKWSMLAGAVVMTGVLLIFFWQISYATLLVFGIAVALAYPLYSVPILSTVFDLIGTNAESVQHRVEYVVLREFALDAGRMIGVLLFLAVTSVSTDPATLKWLILAIGSGPLIAWLCLSRLFSIVHSERTDG